MELIQKAGELVSHYSQFNKPITMLEIEAKIKKRRIDK